MNVELRELNIKDIDMIKNFFRAVFTQEPWNDDWSDEEQLHAYIMDLAGNRNSLTLGLFENDNMVGLSMGHVRHWYKGTEYYIDELCIKREEQGKGFGTEFLKQIESHIRKKKMKNIFLQTEKDVSAYQFYIKNDFIELEKHVSFYKVC